MTTEALGSAAPVTERREWWETTAEHAVRWLRGAIAVVRPAAWVLMVVAVLLWVAGSTLGWWELTVAATVLTVLLALCALFLIGRTAYDVTLDLTRTRVVVGERAVGALTLSNSGTRAILPSRVVLPGTR